MREKILFIINPISGAKNKIRIPDLIKKYLNHDQFDYEIRFTEYFGHAEKLSVDALNNNFKKIIAVGGDGTVNEIARTLIHKECGLGIIPSGSGNGLSRHLGLPLSPIEAIKVINGNITIRMDCGLINDHPFFCTSGVGFDAHIGKLFAKNKTRGFNTYVRTILKEFLNYSPDHYSIIVNGEKLEEEAFLITFANAAQYGNNAIISPTADIQDGLLDLCILKPFPKYMIVPFGISLFKKTSHKFNFLKIIKSSEIIVERNCEGPIHLDGEPFEMGQILVIKTITGGLKVLVKS